MGGEWKAEVRKVLGGEEEGEEGVKKEIVEGEGRGKREGIL